MGERIEKLSYSNLHRTRQFISWGTLNNFFAVSNKVSAHILLGISEVPTSMPTIDVIMVSDADGLRQSTFIMYATKKE